MSYQPSPKFPDLYPDTLIKYVVSGGGGTKLNVVETGNPLGIPILFIHGYLESHMVWCFQLTDAHLKESHRLIAVDMRGHGFSDKPFNLHSYSSLLFARDISKIINVLDLNKVNIVSRGMGTLWVGNYINRFGIESINKMVSVAGLHGFGGELLEKYSGRSLSKCIPLFTSENFDSSILGLRMYARLLTSWQPDCKNLEISLIYASMVPIEIRRRLLQQDKLDPSAVWSKTSFPLMAIHSPFDENINFKASEDIVKYGSNSQLKEYPGGCSPQCENPDRFSSDIRDFFR